MKKPIFILLVVSVLLYSGCREKISESPTSVEMHEKSEEVVIKTNEDSVLKRIADTTFYTDGQYLYYGDKKIENSDSKSFTIIPESSYFAKDKNQVYYYSDSVPSEFFYIIKGADPQTFKPLTGYYSRDDRHIFAAEKIIDGADLSSFEIINNKYAKDKNTIYYYNDPACFECDNSYMSDLSPLRTEGLIIISDGSPSTFQLLNPKREEDGLVYADSGFAKDEKQIYYNGVVLRGADIDSFQIIDYSYSKDKNNIYFLSDVLKDADPETFQRISDTCYMKDKARVYYNYKVLEGADPETFVVLNSGFEPTYSKDKNHVYSTYRLFSCETIIIEGADVESFEVSEAGLAKDKSYCYRTGERVDCAK